MPGGRGNRRGPEDRDTKVSKKLSWILRHGAEKEGLKLDGKGYANVADLLKWNDLRSLKVTFSEIRHIVETNAKKRFELIPAPSTETPGEDEKQEEKEDEDDPSRYLIRASQGHSLAIASEALLAPLDPSSPDCPALVVHGTTPQAWKAIQKTGGLSRMGRGHVHFATGLVGSSSSSSGGGGGGGGGGGASGTEAESSPPSSAVAAAAVPEPPAGAEQEAEGMTVGEAVEKTKAQGQQGQKVVSGMRASATVLVWVDVKRSAEGGLKWWRSANGVILTEGDEKGFVKMEWVDKVEERSKGTKSGLRKVIWERERTV